MRLVSGRLYRTRHWLRVLVRLAATLALCSSSMALAVAQVRDASAESTFEPERSRKGQDEGEPSFFVLPIRTELQRKLIAGGKTAHALVEINAFATIGKTGVDRMRALDLLALRRSLAAIKAQDPDASIMFVIGFLGFAPPGSQGSEANELDLLTKECRELAAQAKLRVTQIFGTYVGTPGLWPKVAAAAKAIELTKETEDEVAVEDDRVQAYPVRTKVTRFLTGWCQSSDPKGADCVVYLKKAIDPKDDPLVGADVQSHIKAAVSKLDLPGKDRIDFHLRQFQGPRGTNDTYWNAIHDRFLGKEAERLSQQLGFTQNSVTF